MDTVLPTGTYQEPPPDAEDLMSPETIAAYARVAATVDMEVADKALCQALKVCVLVERRRLCGVQARASFVGWVSGRVLVCVGLPAESSGD